MPHPKNPSVEAILAVPRTSLLPKHLQFQNSAASKDHHLQAHLLNHSADGLHLYATAGVVAAVGVHASASVVVAFEFVVVVAVVAGAVAAGAVAAAAVAVVAVVVAADAAAAPEL